MKIKKDKNQRRYGGRPKTSIGVERTGEQEHRKKIKKSKGNENSNPGHVSVNVVRKSK